MARCKAAKIYKSYYENYTGLNGAGCYAQIIGVAYEYSIWTDDIADRDEIYVYSDGSVFMQRVDMFPEFWHIYFECGHPRRSYYNWDTWDDLHPVEQECLAVENDIGFVSAWKSVELFLNEYSRLYPENCKLLKCDLYKFNYICLTNDVYTMYNNRWSYPSRTLYGFNNKPSLIEYYFWLRVSAKNQWQSEYCFDIFLPRYGEGRNLAKIIFPTRDDLNFECSGSFLPDPCNTFFKNVCRIFEEKVSKSLVSELSEESQREWRLRYYRTYKMGMV
ncbi:hypothetical protein [Scytonema sp. NUACC26]|uniref:hypothetical protein n=1 Tax=Scytonema sp. NUACC26 TaxID=3140176 RepID=UPI0034DC8079